MWPHLLFALILLLISGLLLWQHRRSWHAARQEDYDEDARDYFRRQYRRRLQTSGMIGLVGLAVLAGHWVHGPVPMAVYWSGVILIVLWIAALAVADLVSTRVYFRKLRRQQRDEHAALQAELQRLKRRGSNGRPER